LNRNSERIPRGFCRTAEHSPLLAAGSFNMILKNSETMLGEYLNVCKKMDSSDLLHSDIPAVSEQRYATRS